jgi:septum formation protein
MAKIILASASRRREDLLAQVGVQCEVVPSEIDENVDAPDPGALVETLSCAKAEDVAQKQDGDFVVIGADTVVVKEGSVYGKPSSEEEARQMLSSLQGDRHEVYTGVTLISVSGGEGLIDTFHVRTIVDMMPMSEEQITAYIQSGEPMDKAGGYGIQGRGAAYIRDVAGDFFNVVGLPISTVLSRLENMGVSLY